MDELIRTYNAACAAVNTAIEAVRNAPEGADLVPLETAFREAVAAADAAEANLKRGEEVDKAAERFTPRALPTTNPNDLGMDGYQVQSYSLFRAINAAVTGDWTGAELEREASDAIAKRLGRQPDGFFVPADVQHARIDMGSAQRGAAMAGKGAAFRDMVAGTDSAGGYLVATELRPQSFIELLRNRLALRAVGATFLSGLVGDIAIPRQTAGATFYWVAESGAPSESQQTVDQVALTPHTGGAFTDISRKLLKQSSVDVENFVTMDLAAISARGIDLAGLHGTGANNQPTGLGATSGIGSVAGGTDGAAPTYNHMIDLETEVAIDNADVGNLSYLTNAKVRGKLKKTLITATYGDDHVWDRKTPEAPINGYAATVTNQVSSTLTKGSSGAVCSAVFFGNWSDLVIGQWGTLDILVDPYTGSTSGTVRIVALQDIDVAVRHAESFSAMLDALTA